MSAPPSTWKSVERRIAVYLGTDRNPLSGGNGKITRSDSRHERLFIETKHGQGVPRTYAAIVKLFLETEKMAFAEYKRAVVVLHHKGKGNVAEYPAIIRARGGELGDEIVQVPLSLVKRLDDIEAAETAALMEDDREY